MLLLRSLHFYPKFCRKLLISANSSQLIGTIPTLKNSILREPVVRFSHRSSYWGCAWESWFFLGQFYLWGTIPCHPYSSLLSSYNNSMTVTEFWLGNFKRVRWGWKISYGEVVHMELAQNRVQWIIFKLEVSMSGYRTTETVTLKNTFNAFWLDGQRKWSENEFWNELTFALQMWTFIASLQ